MTEETTPPRRSLATFLRGKPEDSDPNTAGDTRAPAAVEPTATLPETIETDAADAGYVVEPTPSPTGSTLEPAQESSLGDHSAELLTGHAQHQTFAVSAEPASPAAIAPCFLHAGRRPAVALPTPRWQFALIALLGALLLLQVAIADRATLAANASTRPLISKLCGMLQCTLPPWHEPAAFSMLSRDIRPLSAEPGVLQVQASFRNDARWVQAWPALRLSLSDADGRVIAAAFTHADIAHMVGATRQWVTISLKRMQEKGIVVTKRSQIVVCRPDVLEEMRGQGAD